MITLLILAALAAFYFMAAEGKRVRIRRARVQSARDNETRLTLEWIRSLRDDEAGAA